MKPSHPLGHPVAAVGLTVGAVGLAAGAAWLRIDPWLVQPYLAPGLWPAADVGGPSALVAGTCLALFPAWSRRRPGPAACREVALTFDDGPDPGATPQVLDALAVHGARATFFVLAEQAARHPCLIERILAGGHALGLHGWDHRPITWKSPRRFRWEIGRCAQQLRRAHAGVPLRYYRPPYGLRAPLLRPELRRAGLRLVLWTLAGFDWSAPNPEAVTRRIRARVRPGDVILLHDGGPGAPNTAIAIPEILAALAEQGLSSVTLDRYLR